MKKSSIILIIILAVLIIGGGVYLMNTPAITKTPNSESLNLGQGTVAGQGSIISIKGFKFSPTTVNIKIGETVNWNNEDSAAHIISFDSGNEIDSPSLSNGQVYAHTFNTAGTYNYHCAIHTLMKGRVVVS